MIASGSCVCGSLETASGSCVCVEDETIELLVPKAAQVHEESSKGKNAQQELPSGWRHRAAAAQNMAPAATPASAAAAATPEASEWPEVGRCIGRKHAMDGVGGAALGRCFGSKQCFSVCMFVFRCF